MHLDVKWLFGFMLVFAAIFFASGGLGKNYAKSPFVSMTTETEEDAVHIGSNSSSYGIQYIMVPSSGEVDAETKKMTTLQEIEQGIRSAGVQGEQIKKELATLEEARYASPLSGKISITSRNAGGSISGEYIAIQASSKNKEKVLVTGLRLESRVSGRGANIAKGVTLVFQNQINSEAPIYLGQGETAYVITGRSPLGTSFKLNKCTGFFNQYQTFNPSLPSRCPRTTEFDLPPTSATGVRYDDACRTYINSLPSCRVILNPPNYLSPECVRYVTNEISYSKCVSKYKNDSDFYDSSWRIYLGRDEILWKTSRELIHLVDQDGKVIDA
ncbi:MAG: hypothetical protein AAB511_00020, partial [Patescibacteria group bacterium]